MHEGESIKYFFTNSPGWYKSRNIDYKVVYMKLQSYLIIRLSLIQ